MANYTQLAGFQNSQDVTISNILLDNFVSFYDWGFLDKGGFYNYNQPTQGMYGGEKTKLQMLKDKNEQNGKVWQSNRQNWVWETGTSVGEPIDVSGVYVNNVFRPVGNTEQPYYINYKLGQVVFDTPLSSSANVTVSYSSKWINVVPAYDIPWFRAIQMGSNRVEKFHTASGDWAQLGQTRVQLPSIAIEVVPPRQLAPYQLGGGQWVRNDILFNVITENAWECKNIVDQITYQNERVIYLYDPNVMAASGVSIYDHRGALTDKARASGMYPFLVDNFRYRDCYIYDSSAQGITELNPNLYVGTVRCKTEVKPI